MVFFFNRPVISIGRTGRAGNIGYAVSFVNEKNSNIIRELRDLLEENEQEIPNWLNQMCNYSVRSSSGGGRSNRGRGGHFGPRRRAASRRGAIGPAAGHPAGGRLPACLSRHRPARGGVAGGGQAGGGI